ncbi:unnamed protein product [Candidula unifasciata]|uniref:procollagen-proline 3-dioxygenase n=1 Tax=Candidula unifasciata TaxID=100452 RepID=A0A8S3YVV6_9EUPU|nr:unnamed protein product [Candidula unifasciata]
MAYFSSCSKTRHCYSPMLKNFLLGIIVVVSTFQVLVSALDDSTAAKSLSSNLEGPGDDVGAFAVLPDVNEDGQSIEAEINQIDDTNLSFEELYEQGVRAYDDHLWYSCANKIERAVQDYKVFKHTLSNCRLECSKGLRESQLANLTSQVPDFSTFGKFLRDADCYRRCTEESLDTHPQLTDRMESAFEKRLPYHYLQFCYYKLDRLKLAASAAYTYYLANPQDVDTKQNIVYYRDTAKVSETDFVDLELQPYKEHYIRALLAYDEHQWGSVIFHFEGCLEEYFKEHERCLSDCEGKGQLQGPEFSTVVADAIVDIMACKLDCEKKLSTIYTEPIKLLLQDIYHHLQFAYYKEGELEKAAEATASFLLLNSTHQVMLDNKAILKKELHYTDDDFIPQKDVAEYAALREEMQALMDIIKREYRLRDLLPEGEVINLLSRADQDLKETDDWMSRYEKLGMHIISKSVDLHRHERFVTDGLLKEDQCEELLALTEDLPTEPIGSRKFDLKVARQRLEDDLNEDYEASLRLFVRAAEVVRHYTQRYLQISVSLHLKYTSIVCWSQPQEPALIESCHIQEDGTCVRFDDMADELYSDSYTTVTYLNTADEDGDFQFLNEKNEVDSAFGIKCGRTVGFNSGDRHTIKVPKSGNPRCAMVIRYTTDVNNDEKDYHDTLTLLQRIDELRLANEAKNAKDIMKQFEEEGVRVVQTGKELLGTERFVADGLASDAQCSTLRSMVQNGALLGDGYDHLDSKPSFISPHTEHEMYQGITIYRAAKLAQQNTISPFGLRAFLELSEKSRLLVENYFNLTKPLYFDYTHLVCRTAVGDNSDRQDLSHPVHADNCLLQSDGSCTKGYPAFTQRDYSAILYLNDDFDGGEFFFAHSNKTEQVAVKPQCGRLVGFNAGDFHGVRAVTRGQRCALALWFTHNPNFKELAHIQARKTLKQLELEPEVQHHEDL